MGLRGKAMRSSLLLTMSEGIVYGSSFIRNMILARMLTKADFGIAAAFAMVTTLLEFNARLGVSRFVIRDKDGADPEFIASAHLMQFLVAVFSAALIAVASGPLAGLFGLENQHGAMLCLALIPLFRGLEHLDIRRFERELRFGPSAMVEMVPQVVITLAAWPLAKWLGDYRAMLILLIAKTGLSTLASHWVAERSYQWRTHRSHMKRMMQFGWPLLVNGFLMFGVLHGDQFLVATYYTMDDLGPYAAAAALVMMPTFFFGRIFNSIMLPLVAKVQDDPVAFRRRYRQAMGVISIFSACCAVGLVIGAEAIMRLVYGPKYVGTGVILACLAIANAFRNIRIAPALAAIAKGNSQNQMYSNLLRVVALIPALILALQGKPVWMLATTGLIGEVLSCAWSFHNLRKREGIALADSLVPLGWVAACVAGAVGVYFAGAHQWGIIGSLATAAGGALIAGAWMVMVLPELRHETARLAQTVSSGGWRALKLPGLARRAP